MGTTPERAAARRPGSAVTATWPAQRELGACEFATLLTSGIHDALAYLNARTRFRFTALYRCEKSRLEGVSLYDRENARMMRCLPPSAPACCYAEARIHMQPDAAPCGAAADACTAGRAGRVGRREPLPGTGPAVIALRLPEAQLAGVLLHFDPRPRILPSSEKEELHAIASLLGQWLAARDGLAPD